MVESLLLTVYRYLVVPLALISALVVAPFIPKLRETLRLRRRRIDWPEWVGNHPTLWIHCASGEFEYAKPVLREWRRIRPDHKIFVSYYSPTYRQAIESAAEVDFSAPLPLDLPGPLSQFVQRLNPEVLAVARTDLWPELCHQVRRKHIPIHLFSATRRPLRGWEKILSPLLRWRMERADRIFTVSSQDLENLNRLGVRRPLRALGDSRYDQVFYRLEHPKPLKPLRPPSSPPILVAGSTWSEDEAVLFPALQNALQAGRVKLVLAPHEPTPSHLKSLRDHLSSLDLGFELYSEIETWNTPVLVIDQVGILAELYTWGDMAFVGGSFKGSVHSVMEPLACGLPTIVGPYHGNNREALQFAMERRADDGAIVSVARDKRSFQLEINRLLDSNLNQNKISIRARVFEQKGASAKIAAALLESR